MTKSCNSICFHLSLFYVILSSLWSLSIIYYSGFVIDQYLSFHCYLFGLYLFSTRPISMRKYFKISFNLSQSYFIPLDHLYYHFININFEYFDFEIVDYPPKYYFNHLLIPLIFPQIAHYNIIVFLLVPQPLNLLFLNQFSKNYSLFRLFFKLIKNSSIFHLILIHFFNLKFILWFKSLWHVYLTYFFLFFIFY